MNGNRHIFQGGSCVRCTDPDTCASLRCAGTPEGSLMSTFDETDEAFAASIESGVRPSRVVRIPAPSISLVNRFIDLGVALALAVGTVLYGGLLGLAEARFGEDFGHAPESDPDYY